MSPTLGLGISSERVSAVLVERSRLVWSAACDRDPSAALVDALSVLLRDCPATRRRSRGIVVALGPAALRLKPVVGLPANQDERILASVVSESSGRFFVGEAGSLTTSSVQVDARSMAWIAAMPTSVLDEIVEGCKACGYRVSHVVPTALALGHASSNDTLISADGCVRIEAQYDHGELVTLRSRRTEHMTGPSFDVVQALRDTGSAGVALADAYGATKVGRRHPLAIKPAVDPQMEARWRRRLVLATAACLTAIVASTVMPTVAEAIAARHDRGTLAQVQNRMRLAQARLDSLTLITGQLSQVATFAAEARSSTLLLSEIARALPDSCALQRISIDSVGSGALTAIGPHAAAILEGLQRVPDITALRVTGPIETDNTSSSPLERVSTQFTYVGRRGSR